MKRNVKRLAAAALVLCLALILSGCTYVNDLRSRNGVYVNPQKEEFTLNGETFENTGIILTVPYGEDQPMLTAQAETDIVYINDEELPLLLANGSGEEMNRFWEGNAVARTEYGEAGLTMTFFCRREKLSEFLEAPPSARFGVTTVCEIFGISRDREEECKKAIERAVSDGQVEEGLKNDLWMSAMASSVGYPVWMTDRYGLFQRNLWLAIIPGGGVLTGTNGTEEEVYMLRQEDLDLFSDMEPWGGEEGACSNETTRSTSRNIADPNRSQEKIQKDHA